jgi:uncharacterized protein YjeT (DUF2065 family)
MNCANCWAVSFVEVLTGIVNRFLPAHVRAYYAERSKDPDGKIILSVDQLTKCTSRYFYKKLAMDV